ESNGADMAVYKHVLANVPRVEAVLKRREDRDWAYLDTVVHGANDTPFLISVDAHGKWLEEESYQGVIFLRALEYYAGTDNDIEYIARSHKSKLLRYFQGLAKQIDETDQQDIAYYFTLLLEGATSMSTLIGPQKATAYAKDMAKKIVYPI